MDDRWEKKLRDAEALIAANKLLEALAIADAIVEEDARCAPAFVLRGKIYAFQQEWDDALSELDHALVIDPGLAVAYLQRGSIKLMAGEIEPAGQDLGRAVEIDPSLEGQANLIVETYAEIVKKEQRKRGEL